MTDLLSPDRPLIDSVSPAPTSPAPGTYPSYLPALLQQDQVLGEFLRAFEQVLTGGLGQPTTPSLKDLLGLEELIDRVPTYLSPLAPAGSSDAQAQCTPEAFLPWLASWVALSLRDDWNEATKRGFISRMVPLYRKRGTKEGLKELLELYVNEGRATPDGQTSASVEIYEFEQPAHYFQVTLKLPNRSDLERKRAIARAILDQEKPAHTFYALRLLFDTMSLGDGKKSPRLRLGVNTLLGTEFQKQFPQKTEEPAHEQRSHAKL